MNDSTGKSVPIELAQVVAAYRKVRQGGKATGVDEQSWTAFDERRTDNLYLLWNRLASGSYHPQAIREQEIPKPNGGVRRLGIPTLRDRIAQQVVKDYMEKRIDQRFHRWSYGYRRMKSAHQALEQVRQNCYRYDWVIDLDISKFFDEIDHELLLKAVRHVMPEKWVTMYVARWLKAPIQRADGQLEEKAGRGTPQGGVISPLLANLYLHYALDRWLSKHYAHLSFVRYADDVVIHCHSQAEAQQVCQAVSERLAEVKLRLNADKTRLAYCKDYRRKGTHDQVHFEFLGFAFRPRARLSAHNGRRFLAFTAEISPANQRRIRQDIRQLKSWRNTTLPVDQLAQALNPKLKGWINYYGRYSKGALRRAVGKVDERLVKWLINKHKTSRRKAIKQLQVLKRANPRLFYHWQMGY